MRARNTKNTRLVALAISPGRIEAFNQKGARICLVAIGMDDLDAAITGR